MKVSEKRCTTHYHACDCREAHSKRLEDFSREVMQAWPESGVEGGDLQDIAERHGLLVREERSAPCGEDCVCVGYGDFPMVCYRKAAWL